jgi:NRPS condensation-like uncharacterized protein
MSREERQKHKKRLALRKEAGCTVNEMIFRNLNVVTKRYEIILQVKEEVDVEINVHRTRSSSSFSLFLMPFEASDFSFYLWIF